MANKTTSRFVEDRLEALRSLDEAKIRRYARKYGARFPGDDNPIVFFGAVHKARMVLPGLTDEEREVSRQWLAAYGMRIHTMPELLQLRAQYQAKQAKQQEGDDG